MKYFFWHHKGVLTVALSLLLINHVSFGQNSEISVVTDAGHTLSDFTISPDGRYLLTHCENSVALWNLNTMQTICVLPLPSLGLPRFGPGNPFIVYIQPYSSRKEYEGYNILTRDFMGIKNEIDLMPRITANGRYMFKKGDVPGTIQVYNQETGNLLQTLTSKSMPSLGKVDLTVNDSLLLLTGKHPQLWNLRKARLEGKLPFFEYVTTKDSSIYFWRNQIPYNKKKKIGSISRQWCNGCFTDNGHVMLGGYGDITTWTQKGELINVQRVEQGPVLDWVDYNGCRYAVTWPNGLHTGAIVDKELKPVGGIKHLNFISDIMADGKSFFSSDFDGHLIIGNAIHPEILYKSRWIAPFVNSDLTVDRKNILLPGDLGNMKELSLDKGSLMFSYLSNAVFRRTRVNIARYLQGENYIIGGCSDGIIALFKHKQAYPVWSTIAHRGQVMDIRPTHQGRRFVTSGSDGWSRIFDWKQKKELIAMYSPDGTDDYLFLTPDNYYKGTKGTFRDIHFAIGTETFNFDQFDLKFNRPDIILQRLGGDPKEIEMMHRAWLKRVKRMGFTPEQLSDEIHVPESFILNANDLPRETTQQKIKLKLSASDSKYRLKRMMLYLNGVPMLSRHGLDVSKKNVDKYEMDYELELATGSNEITFSCINEKGAESNRKNVIINYTPTDHSMPDLYIVALGVSKYSQDGFNLQYAEKDAHDFVKLMTTSLKSKFNKIFTLCLTDAEVTKNSVSQVKTFVNQSLRDDVVLLYYAGHGLLDSKLDYYLSTYNVDFNDPSQDGISFEQVEEWFDGIAALNRCCFIDACHSGELDKDDLLSETKVSVPEGNITFRNAAPTQRIVRQGARQVNSLLEDLFIDTRWGIGATIMSSAGGLEAAMEGEEWKNGLFTWCMQKGMTDPKADSNNDGKLTMGEYTQYLKLEVSRLSGGKQQPTMRSGKSVMNNFVLRQ